jgi:hypothetical protein
MTLTFGNIRIGTKHLYLLLLLILFFNDRLFMSLFVGDRGEEGLTGKEPEKFLMLTAVLFTILFVKQLNPFLKRWGLVGLVLIFYLILESYGMYGRPIVYPHVFSKALIVFLVLFLYPFFRGSDPNQIKWLCYLLIITFFVHLVYLKSYVLSIASFVGTERGFAASSVYLLLLPCLYFFNRYLRDKSLYFLAGFFLMLFFIFFLQHRTVWIATAAGLLLNLWLLKTRSRTSLRVSVFFPMVAIPAFGIFVASTLLIAKNPEFVEQLVRRVEDIQNVSDQGTGSWRLQQFMSYMPYIRQHLVAGMRFEGFELPIQFYDHTDRRIWPDGTGHHFHSWYVDRLFYFGIIGLVFTLIPMVYLVLKTFRKQQLSLDQIVIVTFALTGIGYGASYDWPLYFYGIIGIAIAYLDREEEMPDAFNRHQVHDRQPQPSLSSPVNL